MKEETDTDESRQLVKRHHNCVANKQTKDTNENYKIVAYER